MCHNAKTVKHIGVGWGGGAGEGCRPRNYFEVGQIIHKNRANNEREACRNEIRSKK